MIVYSVASLEKYLPFQIDTTLFKKYQRVLIKEPSGKFKMQVDGTSPKVYVIADVTNGFGKLFQTKDISFNIHTGEVILSKFTDTNWKMGSFIIPI